MNAIDKKDLPVQTLLLPNHIIVIGKILNWISPFVAARYAARVFLTPYKYDMPEREKEMYEEAKKQNVFIKEINRKIMMYHYGTSDKKILLVHGWSGTGTQLSKIAKKLVDMGYSTISFDAPAHGKSAGKRTVLPHFIKSIYYLEKEYGPFEAAIGHSLGGIALLKATQDQLKINKLVVIGTANSITTVVKNFVLNLKLTENVGKHLKSYFDKRYGQDLDNYSGAVSAKGVNTPTLVIHDKNDVDVHFSAAHEITKNLKNGELVLTKNLGHRKILGDQTVIARIIAFITS